MTAANITNSKNVLKSIDKFIISPPEQMFDIDIITAVSTFVKHFFTEEKLNFILPVNLKLIFLRGNMTDISPFRGIWLLLVGSVH